eukprot:6064853-Pyramimonas_sp.AAC.1
MAPLTVTPSSSKTALGTKRINHMSRARVKALKKFLGRPWVKEKLCAFVKQCIHASRRRLCDALADA